MPSPRVEVLTENVDTELALTPALAHGLQALGRQLRSDRGWWGSQRADEDRSGDDRTVVRCQHVGDDRWRVRVVDAIGVIAVNDLQLVVTPKIPLPHLVYLLEASQRVPQVDDGDRAELAEEQSFWRLIARWFVIRTEELLRRGLIRDYREAADELQMVRGRVTVMPSTRSFYQGRVALLCEFEDFDEDNPLNRILLAGTRAVARSPALDWQVRRRARTLSMRLEGVSDLQPNDLRVRTDLRTAYYSDAIALARNIIINRGRQLSAGDAAAWTFLFRTPEAVEEGIRSVLTTALTPHHTVTNRGLRLEPSTKTLNPDLVFDGNYAVADVKYKLGTGDWVRADLYQAIAFATGYRTSRAAIVSFGEADSRLTALNVGDVSVDHFVWPTDYHLRADQAATRLIDQVTQWLDRAEESTS